MALNKIKKKLRRKNRLKKAKESNVDLSRHIITLQGNFNTGEPPTVVCTCGWSEGPDRNLMNLGLAGKKHSLETGHEMRKH